MTFKDLWLEEGHVGLKSTDIIYGIMSITTENNRGYFKAFTNGLKDSLGLKAIVGLKG